MIYLLDTCTISDFFKKNSNVMSRFKETSPNLLSVSSITVMEIEYGLSINPERAIKLEPLWRMLIRQIQIVPYTFEDARITAHARAYLKSKGIPIGPYDILLAGTALNQKSILVTSNTREFIRVPHLQVEDWQKVKAEVSTVDV